MTTPLESKTPLTDALDESLIPWASDQETMKQLRILARSLELKLNEALAQLAEANDKLEIHNYKEKCVVCNQLWSPSLVESSHCIFCICNGYKSQTILMTGEIELLQSKLAEAQKDKERLDWLEKEQPSFISPVKAFKTWIVRPLNSHHSIELESLRTAIDSAMKPQQSNQGE